MALRLIFMGTPDFSVAILAALIEAGHEIAAVYSQPPRPAGRGHKEQLTPVHAFAAERGLTVLTPKSLRNAEAQAEFAAFKADAAVVAAYGLILPQAILEAPAKGCLNVHASLLPRWRGAAPIQRAIQAGDAESGVTIMQMDVGLDTGDMLLVGRLPITATTTGQSLHDDLAALGAKLIVEALDQLPSLTPTPQSDEGVTYAAKLTKEEGRLDWSRKASELDCTIRAFTPWPGVWFEVNGERIKLLAAEIVSGSGEPGTLLDDALTVACGEGALRLQKLQRAGKGALEAEAFLRGYAIPKGTKLCPATN
jgi:methionyl-tRNA formyltransferase